MAGPSGYPRAISWPNGGVMQSATTRAADIHHMGVYGQQKFDRLVALKRRYDPTNLLRLNHNIPPD